MSIHTLLHTFTDCISDALLSAHQPQALHFDIGPRSKTQPASVGCDLGTDFFSALWHQWETVPSSSSSKCLLKNCMFFQAREGV